MINGMRVFADYSVQVLPENQGNPLIEALPLKLSKKEANLNLMYWKKFDETERQLEAEDREECPERLHNYIWPMPDYYDCYRYIRRAMVNGYRHRNPLNSKTIQHIYDTALIKDRNNRPQAKTTGETVLIVGLSGMGKSTMVERVLTMFPQAIIHKEYQGNELRLEQIPWIKIECPSAASRKALCNSFFKKMDEITNHQYDYSSKAKKIRLVDDLLSYMETVASSHFLGMLVIDEMQNMSLAKAGGAEVLLQFFDSLTNTLGVPLTYIGTPKTFSIFPKEFRSARRASSKGFVELYNPEADDPWFEQIVQKLWENQWVKKPVKLTDSIKALYYDLTQGITSLAIDLMCSANQLAIDDKVESIDEEILKRTYKKRSKLVHKALEALRNNNLENYEDLMELEKQRKTTLNEDLQSLGSTLVNNKSKAQKVKNALENTSHEYSYEINTSESIIGFDLRKLEIDTETELFKLLVNENLIVEDASHTI